MGKHFQFGDEGDVVTSKDNNDRENVGFQIDRRGGGGGNFSFGSSSGNRGRGRGDENSRGRGMGRGDWNSRGGGSRGRGGSFRGRGDGNFRGRGRGRGEGNFRGGRGRGGGGGGRFSKTFNSREDTEGEEREKLGVLPDELMAYYRQVSATVEAGFDDGEPELKKNFLDNVFIAVKAEGVKVSQNQTVSHILEGLLPHSLPAHLRTLFCEFCNHLPTVTFDRFASHVFQTLIQYIPDMYDDDQLEGEDKDSFKALVEKLCAYSLSEIQQFLTDTYGSHVLRSLLEVLGGVQVKEEVTRSHSSQNKRKEIGSRKNLQLRKNIRFSEKLSSDFQSKFDAIKSEVFTILKCEATDLLTDPNFCLVLQTILLILHQSNTTEYKEISQTLMERARPLSTNTKTDDGDEDDDNTTKSLPSIVQNSVGSYLIELLVSLSSPSDLRRLYDVIFKGTLSEYALHPVANYVLQKLCAGVASSPAIVTEMVCEVAPYMEDILACNHIGVITKMAEASLGNQALEKILTQAVMQAFHCDDTEEKRKRIAPLIASMTVYEVYFPSQTPKENEGEEKEEDDKGGVPDKSPPRLLKNVSIHGSLLLQQLIKFEKPKYLVTSLLALTPAELSNLASDQCGSHVVEAFFNSPTVWDRQKDDFVKKIQGYYINIACNKNGSRCLEGMWKGCGVKNKTFIAQELMKSRQRLESDRFGKFLWYNFKLMNFVTRQKDWINFQAGIKKKEKLLQEILEGSSSKKSKDGKRQADEANIGDVSTVQPKKKRKTGGDEEKPNKEEFNEEKPNKEEFKKQKHKKSKKGKS